ncbi:MAG: CBS domain-containing protein [Desulfotomaculaceae bacterium]|nr:CBS domain-containing protein [Desulfotomaculaceae bacterium]
MKVRDIMTENVEYVSSDTNLNAVAKLMADKNIGSVPVCLGKSVLGIITDRDIVIRAVAKGKNPTTVKADEVMSKDVISVSQDTDAHEAADKMAQYQIKRLPVIENGNLVGILSLGDLAIESIHIDEAGDALSSISQGIHH